MAYFYKEGKGLEYMRYSMTEARVVIEQLRKCSISDLDALFNVETLPVFEELEGETAGAILALNPGNPRWLMCMIKIVLKSPLRQWTGKKFLGSFDKGKNGAGINLFKSKLIPCIFKFDTYIKNAYLDDKPCLVLDYRAYRSLAFGLIDNVRKIKDGIILGQAYYKFPWRKQMWFVGYFVLCALNKDKI